MKGVINKIVLLIVSLLPLLLIAGCDGTLNIKGNVSELVNPPLNAQSSIFLDGQYPDISRERIPISDAVVRIYEIDKNTQKIIGTIGEVKTDLNGNFDNGWATAPGVILSCEIQIEKKGYNTVTKEFTSPTYDKSGNTTKRANQHEINAILVKNK